MKIAQYKIVNANGHILWFFGSDFQAAKQYAVDNEGCGLKYGLRIKRYYVKD